MRYRIADLDVEMSRRKVSRNGETIPLPDLSWRVFAALIERAPATVSYDELARAAWAREHVSQDAMTQRIRLLRQALGDDSSSPRYVGTERGAGYCLLCVPEKVESANAARFPRRPWLIAAGAATILAIIGAWLFTELQRPREALAPDAQTGEDDLLALTADALAARGNEYLSRGSYEDNEDALYLFVQALEKDPDHADALSGLSLAFGHRATKYDFGKEAAHEAEAAARRALKSAPGNARSWHALGLALDAQGKVSKALQAYQQAVAIDPDEVSAMSSAAYLLQIEGRLHEALLMEKRRSTMAARPCSP